MRITPLNMEDHDYPWNGVSIEDRESLAKLLDDAQQRRPFLLELARDNGFKLIIGIGGPLGCVQYSSTTGAPPYLMAAAQNARNDEGEVEFVAGGTATPVPMHRCFPIDIVKRIVFRFFERGDRCPDVRWEEV